MFYRDLQLKIRDLYNVILSKIRRATLKATGEKTQSRLLTVIEKILRKIESPYIEDRLSSIISLSRILSTPSFPLKATISTNLNYSYVQHIFEYIIALDFLELIYSILYEEALRKYLYIELLLANIGTEELYRIDNTLSNICTLISGVIGFNFELNHNIALLELILENKYCCEDKSRYDYTSTRENNIAVTLKTLSKTSILSIEFKVINNVDVSSIASIIRRKGEARLGILLYELATD